jgi:hypothetical protein
LAGAAWRRLSGIHAGSEEPRFAPFLGFFSMREWYTATNEGMPDRDRAHAARIDLGAAGH